MIRGGRIADRSLAHTGALRSRRQHAPAACKALQAAPAGGSRAHRRCAGSMPTLQHASPERCDLFNTTYGV